MSTGPTYTLEFSRDARKALAKLPKKAREAVGAKIDALRFDPRPHGGIKLVGHKDLYRVRSGTYRVIYRIEDDRLVVVVLDAGDRKDVYGGL